MRWAPIIRKIASMERAPDFDGSFTPAPNSFKEDDELIKNIMHFSQLAHHAPPGHPWPQFAEFISGDIRICRRSCLEFRAGVGSTRPENKCDSNACP